MAAFVEKLMPRTLAGRRTLTGYLVIKAPYDGRVTQRNVDTGHFVQPASANSAKPTGRSTPIIWPRSQRWARPLWQVGQVSQARWPSTATKSPT